MTERRERKGVDATCVRVLPFEVSLKRVTKALHDTLYRPQPEDRLWQKKETGTAFF